MASVKLPASNHAEERHKIHKSSIRLPCGQDDARKAYNECMAVFIGHLSALAFWRSCPYPSQFTRTRAKPREGSSPTRSEIEEARASHPAFSSRSLDVLVASPACRRKLKNTAFRVWSAQAPSSSFVKVGSGCYVSTPESCFLQLSRILGFEQSLKVGMELCGTYALSENGSGFVVKDWNDRCTSARAVSRFAELALSRGVRGARRAARLSSLLATGSHSPAETNVYLLLCLPKRHGGYGMYKPLLNPALKLSGNGFRLLDTEKDRGADPFDPVRRPDLFWSNSRIALEYESDMAHSGKEKLLGDSRRRGDFEKAGIHVLTLTSRQLYNEQAFDKMARTLMRLTGGRQRGITLSEQLKRSELRKKVLLDGRADPARMRDGSFASNAYFDDALQ